MTTPFRRALILAIGVMALPAAAACGSSSESPSATPTPAAKQSGPHKLVGVFRITDGRCSASQTEPPSGSYFGMLASKSLTGPFVSNGSSADASGPCVNKNYTPMIAGTDGGLKTGDFQPNPTPAFDAKGNALAARIVKPVTWFGTAFGLATQSVDPQTKAAVESPSITAEDGKLTGNMAAVAAAWNNSYFNQGAPKPDGTSPGITTPLSGTISCDGSFTMTWTSTIVGGAFNNFTGTWHLTGTFVPASGTVAQALGCGG